VLFAAAVIYAPLGQAVFGTAPLPGWVLALLLPMPLLVWGADEIYRALLRRASEDRISRRSRPFSSELQDTARLTEEDRESEPLVRREN